MGNKVPQKRIKQGLDKLVVVNNPPSFSGYGNRGVIYYQYKISMARINKNISIYKIIASSFDRKRLARSSIPS